MNIPARLRVAALAVAVTLAGCESAMEPAAPDGPALAVAGADMAGPATYIVAARSENALPEDFASRLAGVGATVERELPQIGVMIVRTDNPTFRDDALGLRGVQAVVPEHLFELPDDAAGDEMSGHTPEHAPAAFDELTWGLEKVGAQDAWAEGNTGAGVRVAVLDAGIDAGHPDLAPNINAALSTSFFPCLALLDPAYAAFDNCDGDVEDWRVTPGFYFNHGTHVAGTIAATGDLGVHGVAPDAELAIVKVCTEYFNACVGSGILAGIVYAADIGADVVNMSLGGIRVLGNDWWMRYCTEELGLPRNVCAQNARYNVTGQDDYVRDAILVYKRAFQYAFSMGTTVVVAAGNNALDLDRSKDTWAGFADFEHTISVSALAPFGWCLDPSTPADNLAYYSNYGRSAIDLSAPGGTIEAQALGPEYNELCTAGGLTRPAWVFDLIFSTIAGGWGWAQGTSMAAPHATGVAALIVAANGGDMSPQALEQALKAGAADLGSRGVDPVNGRGQVKY
jgi:subtilisin family serine protease